MLTEQLKGVIVPVVTPFTEEGELDTGSFRRVVQTLMDQRAHGIVINGTTGECPTVRPEEVRLLMEVALEARGERTFPILIGTGSNDTAEAVSLTKQAQALGADGALVVTPYYNRPSKQGVMEHYRRVADAGLPVVAYHIPHRTGLELTSGDIAAILGIEGVAGIKESTGGVRNFIELSGHTDKALLCGDDPYFFAALCCGASGAMMASANMYTGRFVEVYEQFSRGCWPEAREKFGKLVPLIGLLFAEPNPSPVKWMMKQTGLLLSDRVRLPMTPVSEGLERKLAELLACNRQ